MSKKLPTTPRSKVRAAIRQLWLRSRERAAALKRDNYTCQVCNKVGGYLHAHHKRGFTHNPELRFDVSNGITLCKKCHWEVHSLKCDNLNQNKMIQELMLDAMVIKDSRKRKTVKKHYNQNALDFGVSAL